MSLSINSSFLSILFFGVLLCSEISFVQARGTLTPLEIVQKKIIQGSDKPIIINSRKTYTCLINFDSLLTDKHDERTQEKALAKLVEKFKGKKARFSTFDFTISELTDGKEKAINDGTHTYSSLANTYLGSVEDEESEFNKLKNRMLDMVDNDFDFGQADED